MFAKIIEIDKQQVLFYKEYNTNTDLFEVHQMIEFKDFNTDLKINFESEDDANEYLQKVDEKFARTIVNKISNIMSDDSEDDEDYFN